MIQKMSEQKTKAIFATLMLMMNLLFYIKTAHGATYTVGDGSGWTFNVAGWENGKTFRAGDILVFNYPADVHNVVVVDKLSYDSCSVPADAPTFYSGNDRIGLKRGPNYFICGIPGHCQSGMKIAANAA